ncbi:hypothetical protein GCM10010193_20210 [Kitasatospora atroaurantiaca]
METELREPVASLRVLNAPGVERDVVAFDVMGEAGGYRSHCPSVSRDSSPTCAGQLGSVGRGGQYPFTGG